MKSFGQLSTEESALLIDLAASFSRSMWPFKPGVIRIDLIEKLGHSQNVAVIPRLAPYALSDDPEVRRASIESIARIMSSLPVAKLAELDALMRWDYLLYYGDEDWLQLSVSDVKTFADDKTMVALASMHPDGYVREAAVEILAADEDEWPIPFSAASNE